jgi:signal transduction histidine kinase
VRLRPFRASLPPAGRRPVLRSARCLTAALTGPTLPAAVEVAAYRIITEAMTNAARHSGARRIEVRLALVGRDLLLEVLDDGITGAGALAAGWSPGVGLISMRDRAAELGGSCQAGLGPGGGRVTASLPLATGIPVIDSAVTAAELSVP